jgi:hypothetical protein
MALLSISHLARELGIDRRAIARQVKRGCPLDLDGARAWRLNNLRAPRARLKRHESLPLSEHCSIEVAIKVWRL